MGFRVFAWSVVALGLIAAASSQGEWRDGRATYYGDEPWLWNIHEGSCGYGYIWKDEPLGWDVAALPDVHPEFAGSCGCCGDMDHFDLSVWAFEKLAPLHWGVMSLRYRRVSCDHVPENKAPDVADPFPGIPPPEGAKRPSWLQNTEGSTPEHNKAAASEGRGLDCSRRLVCWWLEPAAVECRRCRWRQRHLRMCKKLRSGGGVKLQGPAGQFPGHTTLETRLRGSDGEPKVNIALVGSEGECNSLKLAELNKSRNQNGFDRYDIYLGLFEANRPDAVVAFADSFNGCGNNANNQVHSILIKNTQAYDQEICIDSVKLM
ncbi:hypothetical protein BSKO_06983 [Bryopsis sp. KO-2023]|nr:hypothetical protein BSKO_06983 [Bryopsis sp. KO-2023]